MELQKLLKLQKKYSIILKMFKKLIQNNLHIFLLISFFFLYIFFCYDTFIMLEPRFDQVRHMAWLESLKESSHIINLENFKRLNDPDGFYLVF